MKILAIGAHPDDIEYYCGGTLLKAKDKEAMVHKVICTSGKCKKGNRMEELDKADDFMKGDGLIVLNHKDGRVIHSTKLVSDLDKCLKDFDPDVIFSHSKNDFHQDHIAVARATISANRKHGATLITYPSWDFKVYFNPNFIVDITDYMEAKLALLRIFESQKDEWYMQPDKIRGMAMGTNIGKYVEKFRIEFMKL